MKKTSLAVICSLALAGGLFSCGDPSSSLTSISADNTAPVIHGVADSASFIIGTTYNLMTGVSASDREDGDLTSAISISLAEPEGFVLTDSGDITFSKEGQFNIHYLVTDSLGASGDSWTTADVSTPFTSVSRIDFSDATVLKDIATIGSATGILKEDQTYGIAIPADTTGAGVSLTGLNIDKGLKYRLSVAISASSAAFSGKLILRDSDANELASLDISETVEEPSDLVLEYDATADAAAKENCTLALEVVNPTEETLVFDIKSFGIASHEETDEKDDIFAEESFGDTNVYNQDNTTEATSAIGEDGRSVSIDIDNFNGSADTWRTQWFVNTGLELEQGRIYSISLTLTATATQSDIEFLWGDGSSKDFTDQFSQKGIALVGGEPTTISVDAFSPLTPIADFGFKLQVGNGAGIESQTNTITLANLQILTSKGIDTSSAIDFDPTKDGFSFEGETPYYGNDALNFHVSDAGEADWSNKIQYDGLSFALGQNYKVAVTYNLDKDITGHFFVLDPTVANWDASLLTSAYNITLPAGTNMTYTSDQFVASVSVDKARLAFNIGGLGNVGPYTLSIKSIDILSND